MKKWLRSFDYRGIDFRVIVELGTGVIKNEYGTHIQNTVSIEHATNPKLFGRIEICDNNTLERTIDGLEMQAIAFVDNNPSLVNNIEAWLQEKGFR